MMGMRSQSFVHGRRLAGPVVTFLLFVAMTSTGLAAGPGPGWSIGSIAKPTNFRASDFTGPVYNIYINATGGTFTLGYEGETTQPIAYNAATGEVMSALAVLVKIGVGNVQVSGGPESEGGSGHYAVSFVKGLAPPINAGEITADGEGLTGGSHTANVSELVRGIVIGDSYTLTVTNTGSVPTNSPVKVRDSLPSGVTARGIVAADLDTEIPKEETSGEQEEHGFRCVIASEVECMYSKSLPAGGQLLLRYW